ncbi:MAG: hypothetical protein ACI4VX_06215 [Succinivibrionaceae bacterium]
MLKKFFPNRIIRFLILSAGIFILAYLLISRLYGEKYDTPEIPPFTAECIKLRPQVVNGSITDLNCSLENRTMRVFYSASDKYLVELEKSLPVKKAVFSCHPFEVKSFIGTDEAAEQDRIISLLVTSELNLQEYCKNEKNYPADAREVNFNDQNNATRIVLTFNLNQ